MRKLISLAALAASLWSLVTHPWGWAFAIGIHPYPGPQTPWTYQLYSGFLPALTVITLLGSVLSLYHLHNCHEESCWRLGKHRIDGTPWCSRHMHLGRHEVTDHQLLLRIAESLEAILSELREAKQG